MNSCLSKPAGWPRQSSRSNEARVSEKISTLPDGVASGAPSGSARNRSRVNVAAGTHESDPGSARRRCQKVSKSGSSTSRFGGALHGYVPQVLDPFAAVRPSVKRSANPSRSASPVKMA